MAGYHGLLVRIAYDICCPVLYVVVHLIRCGFVLMWFGVYIRLLWVVIEGFPQAVGSIRLCIPAVSSLPLAPCSGAA